MKCNLLPSWRSLVSGVIALVGVACIGLLGFAGSAQAVDFSGKRIEWIIPFGEGGGADTWARFLAPFLREHLPGKPVIVIRNVPGGGSVTGANQFHARARPDGLTILGTSGSTQFPYLLGDRRVRYEYRDWKPVMASPLGGVVYVRPGLGVQSAEELGKLKDVQLTYASQSPTGLDLIVPLGLEQGMGLNLRMVFGFESRGAGRLAFERGETNIDYQTTPAYLANVVPLVEAGEAVPLFTWGALDEDGNIVRDPTFPDLPHFIEAYEMMHGEPPSGKWFDAWRAFFIAGFGAQKFIFLPKDTPDDIVQTWREAAAKAIASEELQAQKELELGAYDQVVGERAERLLQMAIDIDAETQEWVRNWLTEEYNVRF